MHTSDVRKALMEYISRINRKFSTRIEKIIVFGSYARGEYFEDSDIDVLVVGDVSLKELVDESIPILLKYGVVISPHDITPEKFELLKKEGASFIKNVEREGIVYA